MRGSTSAGLPAQLVRESLRHSRPTMAVVIGHDHDELTTGDERPEIASPATPHVAAMKLHAVPRPGRQLGELRLLPGYPANHADPHLDHRPARAGLPLHVFRLWAAMSSSWFAMPGDGR